MMPCRRKHTHTGKTQDPAQAQLVHTHMRQCSVYSTNTAANSVNRYFSEAIARLCALMYILLYTRCICLCSLHACKYIQANPAASVAKKTTYTNSCNIHQLTRKYARFCANSGGHKVKIILAAHLHVLSAALECTRGHCVVHTQ